MGVRMIVCERRGGRGDHDGRAACHAVRVVRGAGARAGGEMRGKAEVKFKKSTKQKLGWQRHRAGVTPEHTPLPLPVSPPCPFVVSDETGLWAAGVTPRGALAWRWEGGVE